MIKPPHNHRDPSTLVLGFENVREGGGRPAGNQLTELAPFSGGMCARGGREGGGPGGYPINIS